MKVEAGMDTRLKTKDCIISGNHNLPLMLLQRQRRDWSIGMNIIILLFYITLYYLIIVLIVFGIILLYFYHNYI